MKEKIEFFYKQIEGLKGKGGAKIEEVTQFTFQEKTPSANVGNFTVMNGRFLHFEEKFLTNDNFTEKSTFRKVGDGFLLELESKTLLIIEIKTNIGFMTYKNLLQQLTASAIKALVNLSLTESPQSIHLQLFIIGKWKDESAEDKTNELEMGEMNEHELLYYSYQKMRKKGYFIFPNFPHFSHLSENLCDLYKKKGIKLQYFPNNSTYNFHP
ncbi:MAG: hypothetical protein ACKVTZ_17865 [Bacteroidia bacterium]